MTYRSLFVLLLLLFTSGARAEDAVEKVAAENEAKELVVGLYTENASLAARVAELETEIGILREELAAARVQADLLESEPVRINDAVPAERPELDAGDITQLKVLDVNAGMKVAVVSGGSRSGMKTGMRFAVMSENEFVGELRIVEVRDQIAGGLMENLVKGRMPQVGDRLILSSKQDG